MLIFNLADSNAVIIKRNANNKPPRTNCHAYNWNCISIKGNSAVSMKNSQKGSVTSQTNPAAESDNVASIPSPHWNRVHSGDQVMDTKQDVIEHFSSAANRREFEQRVKRCKRPVMKTFLFCFMPPGKVEVILSHDCGLDVSNVDVEQLKKELCVSPQINIELLALAEESHFQQTAIVTVSPGHEISDQRVTSIITMFLIDPITGEHFVTSTGHQRNGSEGDQLLAGQHTTFATVNLVKLTEDREQPTIDVILAKLHNPDVSNEVIIDGRRKILSQRVESSDDCVDKKVQMFREGSGDKKGIIHSLFSDGRNFRECLEILCIDNGRSIHDDGESGTLLVVVSPEADPGADVVGQEVGGIGMLVGLYTSMKFTNGTSRISSVAVPLDRTMDYITSEFPRLQILRSDVFSENIAVSTSHSDGESLPLATNGQHLEMSQGSGAGFALQEEGPNEQPSGDVAMRLTDSTEFIIAGSEPSRDISNAPRLLTQAELCTEQPTFQTNESLPRVGVQRCRPGKAVTTTSSLRTVRILVYSRHSQDDKSSCQPPTGNVTELDGNTLTGRNTSATKTQLKQLVYGRKKTANNETTVVTAIRVSPGGLDSRLGQHVTTMHSLPYELHEMLLKRSSCLFAKTLLKTDARPDIQLFNTLSSVCRYFHFVLTVRRRHSVRTFTRQQLAVVCRPYRVSKLLLTMHVGQRLPILGLCTLNGKLYVIRNQSTTIDVYISHQPQIQLCTIQTRFCYIADIASCRINNCVYVVGMDTGRRGEVDRVIPSNKVVDWLQNVGNVGRLSVTPDGRVVLLIVSDMQGEGERLTYRGRVEVYNPTGVKLTKFNLPHDIVNPWCVVQTNNKSFIVSHGDHSTELNRVCEVNNEGFIVTSHGGRRGSGLGQLNGPFHFALDSEEQVLIVDSLNQRVLLLDRQLNTKRVLLSWSEAAKSPGRLLYDMEERRLFIVLEDGCVEIYKLYA